MIRGGTGKKRGPALRETVLIPPRQKRTEAKVYRRPKRCGTSARVCVRSDSTVSCTEEKRGERSGRVNGVNSKKHQFCRSTRSRAFVSKPRHRKVEFYENPRGEDFPLLLIEKRRENSC